MLAVTFGSTAGLKPELPKPPEEKKTTAGQLAIDRKNILSRVDEAMSGWEELVGEGDEGEGGDSPSQLEVRDAVVEETDGLAYDTLSAVMTRVDVSCHRPE